MITASRLAGHFAAHAIRTVSESDGMNPILAFTDEEGGQQMQRLMAEDPAEAVAFGRSRMESNEMDAVDAVLLFDGRITSGGEKLDAIIIEMRAYFSPKSTAVIAIPYTPKGHDKFRVHRPKILVWKGCEDFDQGAAMESFFAGVGEHERGAKVWDECLDESK